MSTVHRELEALHGELESFHGAVSSGTLDAAIANRTITELSRILVPLNYTRGARFDHDPALPLGTIPMLDGIAKLQPLADAGSERLPFVKAGIVRAANRVANTLYEATELVRGRR